MVLSVSDVLIPSSAKATATASEIKMTIKTTENKVQKGGGVRRAAEHPPYE